MTNSNTGKILQFKMKFLKLKNCNSSINSAKYYIPVLAILFLCSASPEAQQYDILLLNGMIVDGSGAKKYRSDVAVKNGKIAKIGNLSEAQAYEYLDINGLVLAPGFIDTHNHADEGLIDPELKTNKGFITQGVTTTVFGVDGFKSISKIKEWHHLYQEQGVGTNYMFYIGHNGIREDIMGMDARSPTDRELARM